MTSKDPFLIIGATAGIGRKMAEILIERGEQVITIARGNSPPVGVLKHLEHNVVTAGLPLDELPDAIAGIAYCPGSIDLKPVRSVNADDLRQAFEVNTVAAFTCVKQCLERLKAHTGSGIVLFSTVAVGRGMPFHAVVASAKGAVEGLTRSLAAELAPHVRVNCIAPSLTRTPLASKLLASAEREKASADKHPLKRIGEPEDIAEMAIFLLSSKAGWITGQVIGVDGGLGSI